MEMPRPCHGERSRHRLGKVPRGVSWLFLLLRSLLNSGPVSAALNDPPVSFELRSLEESFPAVANGEAPTFQISVPMPDVSAADAWTVVRNQRELINSMPAFSGFLNFTGDFGEWLMQVRWHTPSRWHRWLRTDVRQYLGTDDASMSLSYFLVDGLGSWLPRLAFRERVAADVGSGSRLDVDIWYEFDEQSIGWPTDNLHALTRERWFLFYGGAKGYAETVSKLVTGAMPATSSGRGTIQSTFDAWLWLKTLGGYKL
uniref:Uncharacterized protein n=1 Tax=Pfiesteria piscicida TaxID=71001 RepID=A3E3R0_PFIPI|nr:unknown [Pfiesteria piscicida]ABI14328.1 unknown [Pfiesteria piscicida]